MKHRELIEQINQLDLQYEPYDAIKSALIQIGKLGVMITTLHPGRKIIRGRPSAPKSFTSISELSYKPQKFNNKYQRASTPNATMFYGSIVPEVLGNSEPKSARITILFEISKFVRDPTTSGEEEMSFSAWEVTEDVDLVSLIHHKNFVVPTLLSQQLNAEFEKVLQHHPNQKISSLEISEFLGNQFAKDPINNHTDYMISAIFSELVSETYDGILYPSVKLAGEGINVAIKPDSVDSKLNFLGASECTIYKNGKTVLVGNNTESVINVDGSLNFNKIQGPHFTSKEDGRRHVGLL